MEPVQKNEATCSLDLQALSDATLNLGKQLLDILSDYAAINPQNKEQILDRSHELSDTVTNLATNMQIADGADFVATALFGDSVLKKRVGGFIRCGGSSH